MKNVKLTCYNELFKIWNNANFCYSIVHGLENYPYDLGRDIDVIVQHSSYQDILDVTIFYFKKSGWHVRVIFKSWATWVFAYKKIGQDFITLEVDFFYEIYWRFLKLTGNITPILKHDRYYYDPWIGFIKRVLIQILGNIQSLETKKDIYINSEDINLVETKLSTILGSCLSKKLIYAINSNNISDILLYRGEIILKLIYYQLLKEKFNNIRHIIKFVYIFITNKILKKREVPIISITFPADFDKKGFFQRLSEQMKKASFTGLRCRSNRYNFSLCPWIINFTSSHSRLSNYLIFIIYLVANIPKLVFFWYDYYFNSLKETTKLTMVLFDSSPINFDKNQVNDKEIIAKYESVLKKMLPRLCSSFIICNDSLTYDNFIINAYSFNNSKYINRSERIYISKSVVNDENIEQITKRITFYLLDLWYNVTPNYGLL